MLVLKEHLIPPSGTIQYFFQYYFLRNQKRGYVLLNFCLCHLKLMVFWVEFCIGFSLFQQNAHASIYH